MSILGIDIGNKGGFAHVTGTFQKPQMEAVFGMPMHKEKGKNVLDWETIYNTLSSFSFDLCIIETPVFAQNKGKFAMNLNGEHVGFFGGVLTCLQKNFTTVSPKTWQKYLLAGVKGRDNLKQAASDYAVRLFPDFKGKYIGPKGGVYDGLSDATMIALYGLMVQEGKVD